MVIDFLKDPVLLEKVRTNSAYQPILEHLKTEYAENKEIAFEVLRFSTRKIYEQTGSRWEFEQPYFARRSFLAAGALLALIYPEENEYLVNTEDALWAICDEFCWVLPAHTCGSLDDAETINDLFSSETASALAEIITLLKDRLDERVYARVVCELERRVFSAFEKRRYAWEGGTGNWPAVCIGNIARAMMLISPKRFDSYLPRFMESIQSFLDSYPDDGTCLEGLSYWQYGFGNFVWFADALYRYTDGKTDLFDNPKVERIATFAQLNMLIGNTTVSFADGNRNDQILAALQTYLHRRYPQSVRILADERTKLFRMNGSWTCYSRSLAFLEPNLHGTETRTPFHYFSSGQQCIWNKPTYSLAVKAGYNDEPHNHLDVGTFILATSCGQELCDLGAGMYTKDYFNHHRYDIFCNNSFSHNVPIINGKGQVNGEEHRGRLTCTEETVMMEFSRAYDLPELKSLTRVLKAEETRVVLTDTVDMDFETFTERFVTVKPPTVGDGFVKFEKAVARFEKDLAVTVTEQIHLLHAAGKTETVYCVDIAVPKGQKEITIDFEIK